MPATKSIEKVVGEIYEKFPHLSLTVISGKTFTTCRVDVTCEIHGTEYHNKELRQLSRGFNCCKMCSLGAYDQISFTDKVTDIFPNLDMSDVIYTGINNKVLVSCKLHPWIGKKSIFASSLFKHQPCHICEVEEVKARTNVRYGVTNIAKLESVRDKMSVSAIKRLQNGNRYNRKIYTFKDGRTVLYQGYEGRALKLLEDKGYTYDDILMNPFHVEYKIDGNTRRYLPDIYIKNENRLIEVKSTYTYEMELDVNLAKEKACIDAGFVFEFIIFDK